MRKSLKTLGLASIMAVGFMACNEDAVLDQQDTDVLGQAAAGPNHVQLGLSGGLDAVDADGNVTVSRNVVLDADSVYILNNYFRIQSGFSITIEAGTEIRGVARAGTTPPGTLVIERGATINANGTATDPILFTADDATPEPGDWGGVIVLGDATVCAGTDLAIEGLPTPNNTGLYGGGNDTDNSGTIRYTVIEYAGDIIGAANEINGLTLGGVGSGTTLEYIQVHRGLDDGFEFFGGTVNAKYLVASRNGDDDFDTDFGWNGKLQFGFAVREPNASYLAGAPLNGSETNGDNNDCTGGFTSAQLSNITFFGPYLNDGTQASVSANYAAGVYFRDLSRQDVFNSVIAGFPQGIRFTNDVGGAAANFNTVAALDANKVDVRNTFIAAPAQGSPVITLDDLTSADFNTDFRDTDLDNQDFAASSLVIGNVNSMGGWLGLGNSAWSGVSGTTPNATPQNFFSRLVLSNPADFSLLDTTPGGQPNDSFTSVTYVGAFALGNNWISGWTNWQ